MQMAAETQSAGAASHQERGWHTINWQTANREVRRLQVRIVKAQQQGKWGKVKSLQHLLTHSFSGKALAVKRVTENQGKRTSGVDGEIWKTPQKKAEAIETLTQRGYHPRPLRRIYIPKSNGRLRPLGIPIWAVHYHSFQAMLGIPCVLLLVERELRSTVIVLLYHTLRCMTSASLLPLSSDGLAQRGDDLRGERNPAWSQRGGTNTLQNASLAPIRNSRDIDIEQLRGSACRVAPISPLSSWCSLRTLWTSSRDVIGIADPLDFADRKRASHASLLSFLIEDGCNLGIGVPRRQRSHTLYHLWAGLAFFPRHLVAWNGQMCESLGLPPNSHIDDIASFRERDIFDQPAHELLALHKGGCRSIPKSRQIMGQAADLLPLRGGEQQGCLFGQQTMLPLQLVIDLFGTGFHLLQSREGHFQVGRLDGLQKAGDHRLINPISAHGLAGSRSQLRMELVTFIHQQGTIALIANTHTSATGATQDDPLQERWSLSNRSPVLLCTPGAIVIQLPLIAQKLVPGDVAWMGIQEHDRPVFLFDSTRSPFDPWFFSWQSSASGLGPPVDVGSRIQRAVQDVQHPLMGQTTPDQFICPLASPPPRWEAQVKLRKGTDDGQGRGRLLKEREDQANGFGNGFIWVKHNPADGIVNQTDRQAKTQAPLFGFALFSSLQAALQPMKLGLRHAALETEQQPVVMGPGIIDSFVINDKRIAQCTDFQQSIPIATRTRQARNLQAEHCSNVAQTHFSYQPLKPIAANGRCARLSLILVNHLDMSRRPSQILGSLDEIILSSRTASVFSNLEKRGLPHINDCEPIKMIRTDFLRRWSVQHRLPPFRRTRFQGESPYSTLIEQADQSHEYADRGKEQATPGLVRLSPQKRVDARTWANLLAKHIPQERRIWLSYLMTSWKRVGPLLLRNPLGNSPEPFNREQGWFCCTRVGFRWSCVICQTRCYRSVIAIRHANDEVRIWRAPNTNELHALAMQRMMRVSHRHPFQRWLVKGGSVL